MKSSLSQCSVLISDFLPLPQEKSPDLFLRTSRGTGGLLGARGPPGPRPRCDTQALLEELEERLASGRCVCVCCVLAMLCLGEL